jgi:hypothetical protein
MNASAALNDLAWNLEMEFRRYSQRVRPPENPIFDYDLSFPLGAQKMAARLGYWIFPGTSENIRKVTHWWGYPAEPPSLPLIQKWWDGENRSCPIAAALGPSDITVVEILDVGDMRAFRALAQWEDTFGRLPRTRIVKTPKGYQIHMRGSMSARKCGVHDGLALKSWSDWIALPGTHDGEVPYRWLRVGDLEPTPDWLMGPRKNLSTRD